MGEELPPQWPCHLVDSDELVNVKWSLWQRQRSPQRSGSEASFAGSLRILERGIEERFLLATKEQWRIQDSLPPIGPALLGLRVDV